MLDKRSLRYGLGHDVHTLFFRLHVRVAIRPLSDLIQNPAAPKINALQLYLPESIVGQLDRSFIVLVHDHLYLLLDRDHRIEVLLPQQGFLGTVRKESILRLT